MGAADPGTKLRPVQALLLLSVVSTAAGRALFHRPHRSPLRDGEIPRIIHQSWKTSEVPEGMARWQASWRTHHADWEYRRAAAPACLPCSAPGGPGAHDPGQAGPAARAQAVGRRGQRPSRP